MFETNTASCGGFVGISDSFGAALWSLDYAMQMAYSNFSGALFHVGGQNVYYNPFTRQYFPLVNSYIYLRFSLSASYKPEYLQRMDDWPNLLFRARHG